MGKKRVPLLIALVACTFSIQSPVSSGAIEPMQLITDCETSKSGTCILAIYVTDEIGKRVKAKLTGRTLPWNQQYSPISVLKGDVEEYAVEGITFTGQAQNLLTPLITYFPIGNTDCFYTPCVEGKEYIQVNISPSRLTPTTGQRMTYPSGDSDLRCGTKEKPDYCYAPREFGQELEFEYHLRLPEDFTYNYIRGRGVSKFSFSKSSDSLNINGRIYRKNVFIAKASRYSSYGVAGADIDQTHPAYEIDTPDFTLWGKNSKIVNSFGSCKTLYGISVVSNTFSTDVPRWDPIESSLNVQIHGPHFKSNGTVNIAFFQARITKALAKCLWGVDLQNASQAKISLTYEDGTSVIATVSSAIERDQYVMSASGMHLSSPIVSMKIIKQSTITCIKGTVKKKVTSSNPQCPKGYKKGS